MCNEFVIIRQVFMLKYAIVGKIGSSREGYNIKGKKKNIFLIPSKIEGGGSESLLSSEIQYIFLHTYNMNIFQYVLKIAPSGS